VRNICRLTHKGKGSGFTLMELLIVVAIVAILVAISIPIFAGTVDKASETACLANQTSARHALSITALSTGRALTREEAKKAVESTVGELDRLCPGGGTYALTEDAESCSGWNVNCEKHKDADSAVEKSTTEKSALAEVSRYFITVNSKIDTSKRLFSTAGDADNFVSTLSPKQQNLLNSCNWFVKYFNYKGVTTTRIFLVDKTSYENAKNGDTVILYKYDATNDKYQICSAVKKDSNTATGNTDWFANKTANWGAYNSSGKFQVGIWVDGVPEL